MKLLVQYLAVGAGGFIGAVLRVFVATAFAGFFTKAFPLGTLFINISGSFFLGWFLTFITARYPMSDTARLAIGAGFVGAYTTFSTYMFESNALIEEGAAIRGFLNLFGSLALGLFAVRFGIFIARMMEVMR